MSTDYSKINSYYARFNEWERLDSDEGKLEFEMNMSIILNHLKEKDVILDLGGGPGRYTIALANQGYCVHLADLSKDLLKQAEERINKSGIKNVQSLKAVNAVDLSCYADASFDVVLLQGPLYHLTEINERTACVKEVYRVLKKNGRVVASFIPYLSGAVGVVDRMFYAAHQVKIDALNKVFATGVFNNSAGEGFQEGYYPSSSEIASLFADHGFLKNQIRSIRGWGSGREEQIYQLKSENPEAYHAVISLINQTAENPAIIETCSHAVYIGTKA